MKSSLKQLPPLTNRLTNMPYNNKPIEKRYYSIGEVSELLGLNASIIRYWETEFTQLKPNKNRKGNRMFTQKDIDIIKGIQFLVREKKFTIDGAKKQLKNWLKEHKIIVEDKEIIGNSAEEYNLEALKIKLLKLQTEIEDWLLDLNTESTK